MLLDSGMTSTGRLAMVASFWGGSVFRGSEPRKTSPIFRALDVSLCLPFGAGAGGSDMIFPLRAADVLALAAPKQGGGSNYRIVKVLRV